jgi:penicillin-binding protein 2
MIQELKKIFWRRKKIKTEPIHPDEIFLDSKNLPDFDTYQFEGRIEKPISKRVIGFIHFFIILIGGIFLFRLWDLQIVSGESFRQRSNNNSLNKTVIYADRGVIYDRNKLPIVWNSINPESSDHSLRVYATSTGFSTTVGYVKYPAKDLKGIYFSGFEAKDGLEKIYDKRLSGKDGQKIVETDAKGKVISESVIDTPKDGQSITLTIDLKLQKQLYKSLLEVAEIAGYKGGAGAIMNVANGDILASASFPEYSSQVMTDGSDTEKIESWISSKQHPFLNRVISGLYTPGSIMKIFIAMGVLGENVIDPEKQILSTGSITIPNQYFPDKPSVFLDWKAHGLVDLRRALAVSSNVYFYEVTGGYKSQKGIGITNVEKYVRLFGFGTTTKIGFWGEEIGTIPNPDWKAKNFNGEGWRVGDTYNTSIGQYGFQVTPLQALKAVSAIANNGNLFIPNFILGEGAGSDGIPSLDLNYYKIVKEGMRLSVTEGTSQAINFPFVKVASKTGTAQLGLDKDEMNSWVIGFWPYENPRYAFAIVMERGPKYNQFGAVLVMQRFLDWLHVYEPEYLKDL